MSDNSETGIYDNSTPNTLFVTNGVRDFIAELYRLYEAGGKPIEVVAMSHTLYTNLGSSILISTFTLYPLPIILYSIVPP